MLLPYEGIYTVYRVAIPKYEWVPVASPTQATELETGDGTPPTVECRPDPEPRPMQLVFAGFEWRTYGVSYLRDNPAWVNFHEIERDKDERRADEAHKPPEPPIGDAPSSDTPQSPAADPALKLDGEGT
jgi:hypothetical protein